MTEKSFIDSLAHLDAAEALEVVWKSPELSLADRARLLSSLHMKSRMTLEGTARMTGATAAQIQALMELAALDDDDLSLISAANPPATTWFLFAGADSIAIRAGVESLEYAAVQSEPTVMAVYEGMRRVVGPSQDDRIVAISGATLGHLAKKAKQYNVLSPKARGFLVSLTRRKQTGAMPTEKQLAWLKSILLELVSAGVVSRTSADGDQDACDEVLNALGV